MLGFVGWVGCVSRAYVAVHVAGNALFFAFLCDAHGFIYKLCIEHAQYMEIHGICQGKTAVLQGIEAVLPLHIEKQSNLTVCVSFSDFSLSGFSLSLQAREVYYTLPRLLGFPPDPNRGVSPVPLQSKNPKPR